jgi:plastocyanin
MHTRSLATLACTLALAGPGASCGSDVKATGTSGTTTGTPGGTGGTGNTGGTGSGGDDDVAAGGDGRMRRGGDGAGAGGTGAMGSDGAGTGATGGMGAGGGADVLNGCDPATAKDLTGGQDVQIGFPGVAFSYVPSCIKVSVGTNVSFLGEGVASLATHPLVGGTIENSVTKIPDPDSPIEMTNTGNSVEFTMSAVGDFGFYCDLHAIAGMKGAIFVVR